MFSWMVLFMRYLFATFEMSFTFDIWSECIGKRVCVFII